MGCRARLYLLLEIEEDFRQIDDFVRENLEIIEVPDLDQFLAQTLNDISMPKITIFIDSINVLLDYFPMDKVSRFLNSISKKAPVIGRLQSNSMKKVNMLKIFSFSQTILNVSAHDQILLCETLTFKKDGTKNVKLEQYSISPKDFSISSKAFKKEDTSKKITAETSEDPSKFLSNLPFDTGLTLKESEKRAKLNVQLPYLDAQSEKGLVGINISAGKKIRSGGQIIYTPDKEDDFDESDPDDDLMI
uniref:Elongator complex protein 5 n=1 Tax=Acrobeloides nanus TaxID=290746 RepID=A0A914C2E2_9BILA